MKKRIIVILLAVLMLLTLFAACKTETPPVEDTPVAPPPTDSSPPPSSPPPVVPEPKPEFSYSGFNPLDYGMEPFANHVTIRVPVFDRAREDAPPVDDNYFTQWVNENFGANMNVTIEYVPIVRTDTMMSYNLLLAGNDWPTVFMEYDWPKVTQWYADGALGTIDLQEFVNTAPTWYQQAGGDSMFNMFQMGGEYIFAPAQRPYWDTNYTYVEFFRLDWYEKAGIPLFTTWQEYVAALELFKELGYSNGKYILPKAPYTENFQFYRESPWPRDEAEWVQFSDVNIASLAAPGAYNRLKMDNIMYNKGLISSEFELDIEGTGSAAQNITDFINGTAYHYANYLQPSMPDLEAFFENNPDGKLGVVLNNTVFHPLYDSEFSTHPQGRATNPAGFFVGFSSKATADELKAAWLYMEWMAQADVLQYMQWGEEGVTYTVNETGARVMLPWEEQRDNGIWMGFSSNKDYWAIVVEVRLAGTIEETIAAITPKNIPQDLTQDLIDNYYYQKAQANAGLFYCDPFFAVPINSVQEYAGTLKPLFQEYATQLCKCNPDEFDALYAQLVEQYKAAGFQEVMNERLAAYQAGNSTLLPDVAAGRAPFVPYDHVAVTAPRVYK